MFTASLNISWIFPIETLATFSIPRMPYANSGGFFWMNMNLRRYTCSMSMTTNNNLQKKKILENYYVNRCLSDNMNCHSTLIERHWSDILEFTIIHTYEKAWWMNKFKSQLPTIIWYCMLIDSLAPTTNNRDMANIRCKTKQNLLLILLNNC